MTNAGARVRFGADWPGLVAAREVEAGGVCWNVQTAGDGADIVLIHGTGASTHSWRDLIGPLSAQARVTAFDLPGHALTSAPAPFRPGLPQTARAVSELLEKVGAAPVIIVGHSAGAAIAARMALSGMARPHTIISINGAFLPFRGPAGRLFPPLARAASASGFASRVFAGRARDVRAVRRLIAGTGSGLSEQGIDFYARLFRDPDHVAGVLRMMAHWELGPLARDLARLETELVLVAGTNDRAVPLRNVDFVRGLAPKASEILLQGLGHLAHEEAPERATALILERLHPAPNDDRGLIGRAFRSPIGKMMDDSNLSSDPRPHAVVIGAGFGGLAAAVRLGARGYRVTICERLDAPGGRAYVFRQDGFTFDAGPTIVTAPFLFEELWTLAGRQMADDVRLAETDPFYRLIFADGSHIDCWRDVDAMRKEIERLAPDDVDGFDRFLVKSAEIYRIGFEQLGHVPFGALADMARIAPDLLRLSGHRSVHDVVARYVKDERIRILLSFHPLLIGGHPFRASAIYCLIPHLERRFGVHFAMGGTGALVRGLENLVGGLGGSVRYGAEVDEITLENRRASGVRLAGGEVIAADIVVSNADAAWTYGRLLPASARKRWSDRKLDASHYSMSLFVWYFGTSRQFPDVGHHTILLGPRYRGLLDDIFKSKRLADDFSLYLHRPTATDPALAPPGCDAFYVLSPAPHLDADVDWKTQAEPYRAAIARSLEDRLMAGLSEAVVTSRIMTPLDFRDRLLSVKGAAFGLEPVLRQSAWFRPHNASEDVEHLYLVGAGTHPGAGLPGVLSSARVLDTVVPDATEFA